jgi:hypothetical protein
MIIIVFTLDETGPNGSVRIMALVLALGSSSLARVEMLELTILNIYIVAVYYVICQYIHIMHVCVFLHRGERETLTSPLHNPPYQTH